jgi:hypothetical protein
VILISVLALEPVGTQWAYECINVTLHQAHVEQKHVSVLQIVVELQLTLGLLILQVHQAQESIADTADTEAGCSLSILTLVNNVILIK